MTGVAGPAVNEPEFSGLRKMLPEMVVTLMGESAAAGAAATSDETVATATHARLRKRKGGENNAGQLHKRYRRVTIASQPELNRACLPRHDRVGLSCRASGPGNAAR